jgi:16S rRNA (cytidine1402-2'-O)-methyltransferase
MGSLYLVATPIGNLEDLSPRGVRVLREALLIAAEDTRHTGKLLKHFGIPTPLTSYFEHNKLEKIDLILSKLAEGDVAVVSDAGTPAINDPGFELVRAALAAGYDVRPIPGPSAPIAALAVSGLPTDRFLYLGYLPNKLGARRDQLQKVEKLPYTLILLESPYRITETLEDILSVLGDRQICVAREMTKLYEEYWRGKVSQALEHFTVQPARGEFTLVLNGGVSINKRWSEPEMEAAILSATEAGMKSKEIAADLAKQSGWSKKEIYQKIISS